MIEDILGKGWLTKLIIELINDEPVCRTAPATLGLSMIYEKAIEVNNELRLYDDEQQDNINHLKEQCHIDYEN